jgi:hypothetical protein
MGVMVKHFGIDDGNPHSWTQQKRRARDVLINIADSMRRRGDWQ